jgi:Rod binding domain-containing protein
VSSDLREAARGLESLLYRQLFKAMRATAKPGGPWSGGRGGAVFGDLLDQALAKSAATGAGLNFERAILLKTPPPGRRYG